MIRPTLGALVAAALVACGRDGAGAPVGSITLGITVASTAKGTASASPVATATTMLGGLVMRFTVASDGHRTSTTIAPDSGLSGSAAMLGGLWLRTVTRTTDDSIDLGVSVPPMLLAMLPVPAGGSPAPGYRVRIKAPNTDSIARTDTTLHDDITATALGTTRVVAGFRCEEWRMATPKDTVNACLAAAGPATAPLMNWIGAQAHLDARRIARLAQLFGGRRLVPVRIAPLDSSVVITLVSATGGAPPADLFTIPANFVAVDSTLLKSITGSIPKGVIPHKP